jgi:nuclear pore complex protein Nup155
MDELWASLDDTTRQQLRDLTYESLFTSDDGKNLGKVLVKAIVNRSIANGSNVETVADALRRKCKSFCSADDVLIFKAQEQLKKASELGSGTEVGRSMLNGSLRLFERVAESLTFENLQTVVEQYVNLQFYAGAVQLCLTVAYQGDRGNMALSWVNDNKPTGDSREKYFESRKRSYDLVHLVLQDLDRVSSLQPEFNADGMYTVVAMKRQEAYAIVNESTDEVFHYDLYDWYLTQGWTDRLLAIDSPFVISYLQKQSLTSIDRADLLWRFYASGKRYHDAASVQVGLAKSEFPLDLKTRIEYLSRAKANGSTTTIGIARSAQQVLLREVTELLEIANIQDEILQRLRNHPRLDQERREEIVRELDGPVRSLSEVSQAIILAQCSNTNYP